MGLLSTIARKFGKGLKPEVEQPKVDPTMKPTGEGAPDPLDAEVQAYRDAPAEPFDPVQEFGAAGEFGPQGPAGRTPERNINLDHFSDPKTQAVIEHYNKMEEGFRDLPERQVVTHDEMREKSIGNIDDYHVRRQQYDHIVGKPADHRLQPEEVVSYGEMVNETSVDLADEAMRLKAIRASGQEVSADDMAHFNLLVETHVTAQANYSGIAAETGRNLNAHKAISQSEGRGLSQAVTQIMDDAGGPETIWATIDAIADASSDAQIASAARAASKKEVHLLTKIRYNMMLSSIRTHAANIGGSIATGTHTGLIHNPARVLASNLDMSGKLMTVYSKILGNGRDYRVSAADKVTLSEIGTESVKVLEAVLSANTWRKVGKAYIEGDQGKGKVANEAPGATNKLPDDMNPALRKARYTAEYGTRALSAEDAFFRTIFESSKIAGLARRKAVIEGNTAGEIADLETFYRDTPTDDMWAEAEEYASKLTFTNNPKEYGMLMDTLNTVGKQIQDTTVGRWFLPFVQTPVNLLGYTFEATGGTAMTSPKKLFGDLTSADPKVRIDAEARAYASAGIGALAYQLWQEGALTGAAPHNYNELRARQTIGWEANSVKWGDEFYELNRMDPAGSILSMYATAFSAMESSGADKTAIIDAGVAAFVTTANMMTDKSILSGFDGLTRIFGSGPNSAPKMFGKEAAKIATSFVVPGILRDFREMGDPYQRSLDVENTAVGAFADTFTKVWENATPQWSENIPPQVDGFGEAKIHSAGMLYRGLVPIRTHKFEYDDASIAILNTNTPLNKPDSLVKMIDGGPEIDLLAMDGGQGWVYRAYQQEVGKARHAAVIRLTKTSQWKKWVENNQVNPDSEAGRQVRAAVGRARVDATLIFLDSIAGMTEFTPKVGGENASVGTIVFDQPLDRETYKEITRMLMRQGPTDEVVDKAKGVGMKVQKRAPTTGLPPEVRF
jgi:hypothetical protein